MKKSPTQKSLKFLRDAGCMCAITEHWNPFAKVRQDLFGIIDILAVSGKETLAIQTTTKTNFSARMRKIIDSEATNKLKAAGWRVMVHGWDESDHPRIWEA